MRGQRQIRGRRTAVAWSFCTLAAIVPASAGAAPIDNAPPAAIDPASLIAAPAPVLVATDPPSPGASLSPAVTGTATPLADVRVYDDAKCNNRLGSGAADATGNWSVRVAVSPATTTALYATETTSDPLLGHATSSCAGPLQYVQDATPPSAPVFSTLDPASPSTLDTVTVGGQAEPGARVSLYTRAGCAAPAAMETAGDGSGAWSATVVVPHDATTSFSATAADAAGNVSPCSEGPQFVQRAATPGPPIAATPPVAATTDPGPQAQSDPSPPQLVPIPAPVTPSPAAPVQPDPPAPPADPGKPRTARSVILSDERATTRWTHASKRAVVRRSPRGASEGVARLHRWNEDGAPEIYLALRERIRADGQRWIQLRVPMRPNGTVGWVPRSALGGLHVIHSHLVVNRRTLRAAFYQGRRRRWAADIGVGKRSTPTPAGRFWVRDLLRPARAGTIYGPFAFGTSAYSVLSDWPGGGVVGIHGTDEPRLIPGRPSHGCVRIRNGAIRRLARLMPLGTPVRIR